jgi:hypothetical protein
MCGISGAYRKSHVSSSTISEGSHPLQLSAVLHYSAFFMVSVKLHEPLVAGTSLLAFTVVVVPISGVTGAIIAKTGKYRWAILTGWMLSTLGCSVLITLDVDTPTAAWVFMLLCAGAGQGMIMTGQLVAAQASCETRDIAYASGMYSSFTSVGIMFGVAFGGTVFQNLLRQRLEHSGLPTDIASNAVGYVQTLHQMSDLGLRDSIIEAYAWAFRREFVALTGISGLGLFLSFGISSHSLDKKLNSEHKLLLRERHTVHDNKVAV